MTHEIEKEYNFVMKKGLENYILPGSPEEELINKIDFSRLPCHIAIIMDGNGRWAKQRNLKRIEGHKAGIESVKETVEACGRIGIKYLTLYAFSKENWRRPRTEVNFLMNLMKEYLYKEKDILIKNKIKLNVIGRISELPKDIQTELKRAIEETKNFKNFNLIIALNYGGRTEIIDAVNKILDSKIIKINENIFKKFLYNPDLPDPDLLIRTSGELRVSNFLLWQIAYTELWITPVLWPDFRKIHLLQAIVNYQKRERRFGRI
ncbi:MAG: isoprenyl transferase [Acidobacteriota bacterium]